MSVTWNHLWTIDGLVAVGTIGLALATGVLALFTLFTARKTKQLAEVAGSEVDAVNEQAKISRAALQASYRPLMVGMPPDLPQFEQVVRVGYRGGHVDTLPNRGRVSVLPANGWVFFSAPFWNVGTGVALPIGTWVRPQDDSTRLTGGASLGIIPPDGIARSRLETGSDVEWVLKGLAGEAAFIFGIQYTDLDGEQMGWSEVEVRLDPENGNWKAGRTNLFQAGDTEPYAFGGW